MPGAARRPEGRLLPRRKDGGEGPKTRVAVGHAGAGNPYPVYGAPRRSLWGLLARRPAEGAYGVGGGEPRRVVDGADEPGAERSDAGAGSAAGEERDARAPLTRRPGRGRVGVGSGRAA